MWLIRVILIMIVFWLIVSLLGWMIRRALIRKLKNFQAQAHTHGHSKQPNEPSEKTLVPCAACGTFIDKAKALEKKGDYYCEEHQ